MSSVTLVAPDGVTTRAVSTYAELEHYLQARGYHPQSGTVAQAFATVTGIDPSTPPVLPTPGSELANDPALRAAFGRVVTAQSFGVVGDGTTDDAAALNSAATFAATYGLRLLLGDQMTIKLGSAAFAPPSGSRIDGNGATLVNARAGTNDVAVDITGKTGISMWNLTVDGNKAGFAGATEYRHNVNIIDSSQILLRDITSKNAKGEGIYIGRATGHSSGIRAWNVRCDGNHRNSLGVIDLTDGKFFGCDFVNSAGTAPQSGVDIEPNDNVAIVRDVTFVDCAAIGNAGPGFSVSLKPGGVQERITWLGGSISSNGQQGVYLYHAVGVRIVNANIVENAQAGADLVSGTFTDVTFSGDTIARNGFHGIDGIVNSDGASPANVKNLRITDCDILDNGAATPGTTYAGIYLDTIGTAGGAINGVTVLGNTISNRSTSNQWYGIVTTPDVSNLVLASNDLRSNAFSSADFSDDASSRQRWNNKGSAELLTATASQTLPSFRTFIATNPPGSTPITLTLPALGETDRVYTIYDAAGNAGSGSPVTIAPPGGSTWANVATTLGITTNGGSVQVYYRSSKWWLLSQTPVPMLTSAVQPSENKYLGWNFDLADAGGSSQPLTSGTLFVQRAYVPQGGVISNVSMYIGTAAAGAVSGQCFAAVFSQSGALLGVTADVSGLLGSTGMKDLPLAAPTTALSPGATVLVALLMNATTPPSIGRKPSGLGTGPNLNISLAAQYRWATAGTGLTAMPGSLTPSGFVAQATMFWAGLK